MRDIAFLLCLSLATVAYAEEPSGHHDAVKEELQKLEGRWVQVSVEGDGKKLDGPGDGPRITITGDAWIESSPAGSSRSTFKINPAKAPKWIDRSFTLGRGEIILPGIYKLESDTLTVCAPFPFGGDRSRLNQRPRAFATMPGDPFIVIVFKRVPDEASQSIAWQSDWNGAFQKAKQEHQLVFVDYFATWCGPCREMDATVFRDPEVQRRLSDFVLLRIDVDKNMIARTHQVSALPSYVVYDPGQRERFRITGALPLDTFSAAIEGIRRSASKFVQAADLVEQKQDLEAAFLVGNTYSHLGMATDARDAYAQARKLADRQDKKEAAQMAETLSAFTFAREGNSSRAIKLLKALAAKPASPEIESLVWLTLGNTYRLAKDSKSALDAYQHAQSLAAPGSTAYKQATQALAQAQ
jgi:uncharacterized protein (TIGR03067 family)